MAYEKTIETVRQGLETVFNSLDEWFDRPASLRAFRPQSGGWSINEILEHVTLTSKYLLIIIDRWTEKAIARHKRGLPILPGESDLDRLEVIGVRGTFRWVRPDHMEPSGLVPLEEVRRTMHSQVAHCRNLLDRLAHGEGSLCTVRMSVNSLGKIDLYQWIYFLAQHARRHIQQMEANEQEYFAAVSEA
jgi:hypothetical protein